MIGLRKGMMLSTWSLLGFTLIILLFRALGVSFAEAFAAVCKTPVWCIAVVVALTLLNKIVGMLKWRVAASHIADQVEMPSALRMIELTALGAFLGQVLPLQVATVLSRWLLLDKSGRESGLAVRATFFEQVFDLIILMSGTVAGVLALSLGLPLLGTLGALIGVLALSLTFLRPAIRLGAVTLRISARISLLERHCEAAASGFDRAEKAPRETLFALCVYSLARLVLVGLRAVAILAVFAPMTASWLVFVASPGISLLTALPVTPAGLGVAEWSWSAVLALNGTTATVAAIAAVNVRIVGMIGQLIVVVGVSFVRVLSERSMTRKRSLVARPDMKEDFRQ